MTITSQPFREDGPALRSPHSFFGTIALTLALACAALVAIPAPAGAFGTPLWTRTYAPPGALGLGTAHAAVAGTGDLFVALSVAHADTGSDLLLARYSASGVRKWTRSYDGPAHSNDSLTTVVADRYGNVTLLASSQGTTTAADWLLVRYARDGRRLWVKRIDGGSQGIDSPTDLLVDGKGNLFAVGSLVRPSTGSDVAAIKYAPSGKRLWLQTYDIAGEGEEGGSAALGPGGRLYIAGRCATPTTNLDILLVSFTTSGAYRWSRRWSLGDHYEVPMDVVADSHGPCVMGYTTPGGTWSDALVVAFDTNGAVRWSDVHDGGQGDDGYVAGGLDDAGRVYVAGYVTPGLNGRDFLLGRYPTNGGALAYTARNGFDDNTDQAYALAVSGDGYSCAAGSVRMDDATGFTAFYLSYTPAWVQNDLGLYDGPGTAGDTFHDVDLSATGVYLTGTSYLSALLTKYPR